MARMKGYQIKFSGSQQAKRSSFSNNEELNCEKLKSEAHCHVLDIENKNGF